jgi:hypothetical protein
MDHGDETTDEAAHYMETLVRKHLEIVLDDYQGQEPVAKDLDDATLEFSVAVVIGGLEADKEAVLACLLAC